MSPSLIERLQNKIELFRLEQRYTRRRNRRSTFVSNAVYVNGEYVYQSPNSTGSSSSTNTSSTSRSQQQQHAAAALAQLEGQTRQPIRQEEAVASVERKKLNRFSTMPAFGSLGRSSAPNNEEPPRRVTQRASMFDLRRH